MEILIITFALHDLADAAYRQYAASVAEQFTQVPGLVSKLWLANPATNTYGGVYVFASHATLEEYRNSEIVAALMANPHLADVTIRAFGTVEDATAITAGPLAVIGAAR